MILLLFYAWMVWSGRYISADYLIYIVDHNSTAGQQKYETIGISVLPVADIESMLESAV